MVNLLDLHRVRVEEQDLSSGDLTIEASDRESIEILARGVSGGSDDDVIQESIDEETMLAYPATDGEAEVFPEPVAQQLQTDLLTELRTRGYRAPTLKVPEGDEYRLTNPNSNGNATVLYRQGNATMVREDDEGGPGNKNRTFVTSAETTQNIAKNSTETVDVVDSQNPGILRDYPYEEDVPASREYDLQAIMLVEDSDGSGSDVVIDSFRLQSEEREFLADNSAFVDADMADYPNDDLTTLPMLFPAEPTFGPGDELDLQVQATESGGAAADIVIDATMIFYRREV